ncbi:MAG TPA: pitrilysin family protein [Acidobacteriota bacterium]|nr:pitrilysin family protein [Acidobacteriota bacterium]
MHFKLDNVVRHRLPNGLTVLVREDHSNPIVASMIWYRVGSRVERPGNIGISHLLEHMMFKGTRNYAKGEIDYITTRHGGANNAFTSRDFTAYYFTFASDRWYPALELEADMMENAVFDPEELELERQVVLEELRMDLDSPWGALRQAVEAAFFPKHPYGYPILGTFDDVNGLTIEQLTEHYRSFYAPNNASLVLVGDFDSEETLRTVERLFGHISPRPIPEEPPWPQSNHEREQRVEIQKTSHVPRLLWAFPAPTIRDRDHYAVEFIDNLLSQGKLARLHRRLVEEERVTSAVMTEFDATIHPYLFLIRAELQPEVDPHYVEELLASEIERLTESTPTDAEIRRVRNQCLSEFLAGFETPLDQAVQLGLLETLIGFEYWNSYVENISSLTGDEIREAARKYLVLETSTKGLVNDKTGRG